MQSKSKKQLIIGVSWTNRTRTVIVATGTLVTCLIDCKPQLFIYFPTGLYHNTPDVFFPLRSQCFPFGCSLEAHWKTQGVLITASLKKEREKQQEESQKKRKRKSTSAPLGTKHPNKASVGLLQWLMKISAIWFGVIDPDSAAPQSLCSFQMHYGEGAAWRGILIARLFAPRALFGTTRHTRRHQQS